MAELDIGEQCSYNECNRLDYLPIKCIYCNQVFCKDHISGDSHKCTKIPNNDVINPGKVDGYMCTIRECSKEERIPVKCPCCNLNFCLKHRHCDDHDCFQCLHKKAPKTHRNATETIVKQMLDKIPSTTTKKKAPATAKARRIKALVERQKIRMVAKGDVRIAEIDRRYFRVHTCTDGGKALSTPAFVSTKWSIGRCIDSFASTIGICNNNNSSSCGPILRLFAQCDILSPISDLIEEFIKKDIIFDGMDLIMDKVSTDTVKLEQLEKYNLP